jgi:hypothetical protein
VDVKMSECGCSFISNKVDVLLSVNMKVLNDISTQGVFLPFVLLAVPHPEHFGCFTLNILTKLYQQKNLVGTLKYVFFFFLVLT